MIWGEIGSGEIVGFRGASSGTLYSGKGHEEKRSVVVVTTINVLRGRERQIPGMADYYHLS